MPIKKVSVVSIESLKIIKSSKLETILEDVNIKDKYYFVHILFVLLGLMHFLPLTFFLTANAYWMYKFRDVSLDGMDASKRTFLQSHFASGTQICNSVPYSAFIILSALFGHKFKASTRVLFGLTVMTFCFLVGTLFVGINTDSWQTLFFCTTMLILATISCANAILQIAILALLARFPPYYMNVYLFGQGCAAVFNSILQILTLAIGTSTTTSALIYFGLGSGLMGLTLILFYFSRYNKLYTYFVEHTEKDITRDMLSYSEFVNILRIIWPSVVTFVFFDVTKQFQTPLAPLVVSEEYGNGNDWNDVYFVPVVTFLLGDICTLIGRILCSWSTQRPSPNIVLLLTFARLVIYVPLLLFCNAQPRSHLQVLLNHDWEYIIVQSTLSFTNGYLFNLVFLSICRLLEPEKIADGYLVLMLCICTLGGCTSIIISIFAVDLL